MNINIFEKIGLGNIDYSVFIIATLLVALIAIIIAVISIVKVSGLKKRINAFMKGSDAKSLEKKIVSIIEKNEYLERATEQSQKDIRKIYKNLELTYQKVGLVKYDAFREMGGQLSFSLALLNDKNNGFLLNSVHSSDGCYSYTKEIVDGKCKLELSKEEQKAVDLAIHCNDK